MSSYLQKMDYMGRVRAGWKNRYVKEKVGTGSEKKFR